MLSKFLKLIKLFRIILNPNYIIGLYEESERKKLNYNLLYDGFLNDFNKHNSEAKVGFKASNVNFYPCLYDNTGETIIEPTYFYQDSWAFERIFINKPKQHVDVGSHHSFVALLSKTTNLTMVDIRPLSLPMESIKFVKGSILELPFESSSLSSLSSLCVIEHIGLGRYGDPIDPYGSEKAIKEIDRVLKNDADFYFSVPIEKENTVYFNAHRAFSEYYLFEILLPNYQISDKKYIYGNEYTNEFKNQFGIGCYHLKKIK